MKSSNISRRGLMRAFAATALTATPFYANAAGFLRGGGDVRQIHMRNQRTSEVINMIYWVEGEYISEALTEVSNFMRDWRQNEVIDYDRRNIDIIAATHRLMETDEPYMLLSGYRSPATNAMLAARNRGVACKSYHIRGMAADLRLSSRSTGQMADAAIACNAGGVGKYGRSNFVHMDCGPIRTWRR